MCPPLPVRGLPGPEERRPDQHRPPGAAPHRGRHQDRVPAETQARHPQPQPEVKIILNLVDICCPCCSIFVHPAK